MTVRLFDRNGISVGEGTIMTAENLVDLIELFSCNSNVWSGESPKIEDPVQDSHGFRTKLAINIFFIDDYRVFSFVETKREICLTQPVDSGKDRVRQGPLIAHVRVLPLMPRRGQD